MFLQKTNSRTKCLFPAALEHIARCVMHPFSPFSPLTSIENMPKTLCFVLDRSSERVTDEHCLNYKSFRMQGFRLCCVIFFDQNQWDNNTPTDPAMLGPFVSLVFLLVQKGSVSVFYWSSCSHRSVEASLSAVNAQKRTNVSIIQRRNAFITRKFNDERWFHFMWNRVQLTCVWSQILAERPRTSWDQNHPTHSDRLKQTEISLLKNDKEAANVCSQNTSDAKIQTLIFVKYHQIPPDGFISEDSTVQRCLSNFIITL